MKWLYVACGVTGGLIAVAIITYRMYVYFHKIAEATSRHDVQMNVLVVLGFQVGLLLAPLGVGLGLLVAVLINLAVDRHHRKRPERLFGVNGRPGLQSARTGRRLNEVAIYCMRRHRRRCCRRLR